MYYLQRLECKKCGYEVNIIRKILTDKELEYYQEIREVCPSCGDILTSKYVVNLKKFFRLSDRGDLLLDQYTVMSLRPEEIKINLGELFTSGFSGVLTIGLWEGEEIMFDFNPLKREIIRYDRSKGEKKLLVKKMQV